MRKGIMAMEELNEEVVDETTDLDFVDAPENDLAEAGEAEAEADATEADLDEAVDTKDTLEEIHEEMGKSLDDGGMSEPEARSLELAVEHMCVNVGFPRARKTFPAMEGFSNKKDRVQATKLAMEGVADKAKAIGESIMAAIRRIIEAIKQFFVSLFNAAAGLKKRADAIAKKAEEFKAPQAADAKIKAGAFVETLEVNGSFKADSLTSNFKAHTTSPAIAQDRTAVLAKLKPILEKAFSEKDAAPAIEAMMNFNADNGLGEATKNKDLNLAEGESASELELTFGQQSLYVVSSSKSGGVKVFIGDKTGSKKSADVTEVAPLQGGDVAELAKAVSTHLETYTKAQEKIKIATSTLDGYANKIKGLVGKDNADMSTVQVLIRSSVALTTGAAKTIKSYDIRVNKAVLDVCAASLAAYGAKKDAKTPKPAAA